MENAGLGTTTPISSWVQNCNSHQSLSLVFSWSLVEELVLDPEASSSPVPGRWQTFCQGSSRVGGKAPRVAVQPLLAPSRAAPERGQRGKARVGLECRPGTEGPGVAQWAQGLLPKQVGGWLRGAEVLELRLRGAGAPQPRGAMSTHPLLGFPGASPEGLPAGGTWAASSGGWRLGRHIQAQGGDAVSWGGTGCPGSTL